MRFLSEQIVQDSPLQVDRDAGIIRGVKILGLDSVNGRRYLPDACRKAQHLYEGIHVNIDHPQKGPLQSRSAYDRLGKLVNVRFEPGRGLYGDLHLLKAHPMADRLMEAAERMPDAFGLSHNAQGQGETKDGIFVVEEITEVRHVDLVADPATTRSLCEGRMKKISKRQLLEMGYEMEGDDESLPPEEAPDEGGDDDKQYEEHIADAIRAILVDGDMSAEEKCAKAKKLLGIFEDEGEGEVEEADDEEKKDDEKPFEEDDDEEKDEDKKIKESRRYAINKGKALLERRKHCHRLCSLAGVEPTEKFVDKLVKLPSQADVIELIEELKAAKPATSKPRSQSPGSGKHLTESQKTGIPDKQDELLNWFRS